VRVEAQKASTELKLIGDGVVLVRSHDMDEALPDRAVGVVCPEVRGPVHRDGALNVAALLTHGPTDPA
jgi:hypothetical protein